MSSPPNRLRVLSVFNRYLERGGEEIAVGRIAGELAQFADLEECTFASASWTERLSTMPMQPFWMIYNPSSIAKVREYQRVSNFDLWLMHNVFPVGSAAIYREAARLRVPMVQYIHNFRPFSVSGYLWSNDHLALGGLRKDFSEEILNATYQNSRVKTVWFAFVLRLMHGLGWWRNVGSWIAISEFMRQKFIEAGIPAEDIFTVRHFWRPQPMPAHRDDGHYLYLGRLMRAKGIDVLFDAWRLVEAVLGERTPKLIIGGEGPMRDEVTMRVKGSRFIQYAGHLGEERKTAAIAGCRAMLAPSIWWEPLGLVTYEAYDAGKPMLAAASGGLSETVIDGETGFLHQPGNAEELARQIIAIDGDADRRIAMGQRGRAWLEEHANETLWRQRFLEAAERAMHKGRSGGR